MIPTSTDKTTSPVAAGRFHPATPAGFGADVQTPRKTVVRHVLPLFSDVLSDGFVLDVPAARRVGHAWAESGRGLERLLDAVQKLTADLVDKALNRPDLRDAATRCLAAQRISELGTRILVELTRGFAEAGSGAPEHEEPTRRKRAELLLSGAAVPAPEETYAVIAVATAELDPAVVDEAFRTHAGEDTLTLLADGGGHVLLPAPDKDDAVRRTEKVLDALGGSARAALVWPGSRSLSASRSVADDILAEATSLEFAPAVHVLDDVLLEFAAAHEPVVSNALLKVIQPLLAQPVLWETLQVLLAEDGNRGKAAERLIVHRSTVDYRLQRIGQLTGHSPCTVRGLRLLATASAMHRLAELRGSAA
ncbi:helix-turn-helix domain-containing protein [Amycolatopsis sp. NEAU-NG30]|uniref:Helix-turn-helix domain-containing protein n=1 Tax=Amycolatopsis melonis TaxID=3156488 RepID=A0ABV0L711_9PSEU